MSLTTFHRNLTYASGGDVVRRFSRWMPIGGRQGLSEPEFYGDFVYKLKNIVGSNKFSAQFIKIISYYKKIDYNINVLQQTTCLVVNPNHGWPLRFPL